MNESETRAELIDTHLQERGWQVVKKNHVKVLNFDMVTS